MFFEGENGQHQDFDLIITGNSFAAVYTALRAAKAGKRVAVVTNEELLCSEFSETLLGFVHPGSQAEAMLAQLQISPVPVSAGEAHIPQGMAAKAALSALLEAGVRVLFLAAPIGLLQSGDQVCGIALATKFGAYLLRGHEVLNLDDRRYFPGADSCKTGGTYAFAVQLKGIDFGTADMPLSIANPGIETVASVLLHRDSRSPDTGVLSFLTASEDAEHIARICTDRTLDLIACLHSTHPMFANCGLLKTALRPVLTDRATVPSANGFYDVCTGMTFLDDAACARIARLAETMAASRPAEAPGKPERLFLAGKTYDPERLYTGRQLDDFLGIDMPEIRIPYADLPTLQTDVLIVGAGTGGAAAAAGTADSEQRVLIAEGKPLPGGTHTLGMVTAFWHGYTSGFAGAKQKRIKAYLAKRLEGVSCNPYTAEMLYDMEQLHEARHSALLSAPAFGAVTDGGRVKGALLAGTNGPVAVLAQTVIDATGDGDIAAFAGCAFDEGDDRDGVTQGYSIWGESPIGVKWRDAPYKGDDDSISTERYSEFLRALYTSQPANSDAGFSPLMTVRESRRIRGEYRLNMADILRGRQFDDTVCVAQCLYDAHGLGSSPAYYTSLFHSLMPLPENSDLLIRIPFRAMLPRGYEGLLVISKAISATRDAGCLVRMNADIQNAGFAAGMAATHALERRLPLEHACTPALMKRLEELEVLPEWACTQPPAGQETLLEGVLAGNPRAMTLATAEPERRTEYEARYLTLSEPEEQYRLGLVLAALGSDLPTDFLLARMERAVNDYREKKTGAAAIMTLSTLLAPLCAGKAEPESRFVTLLCGAVEALDAGGSYVDPDKGVYHNSKVSNRKVPNFKALMAVAAAAERVASPALALPLRRLSEKPMIRLEDGREIHSVQLYLRIAASAARCGDQPSAVRLAGLLDDPHLFFRRFIVRELSEIYQKTHVSGKAQWLSLASSETPAVIPYTAADAFWK